MVGRCPLRLTRIVTVTVLVGPWDLGGVGGDASGNADGVGDFDDGGDFDGVGDVVGETEAHTANGMDHLRARSCLVELATQVRQMHVDDMTVTDPSRAPDGVEQLFASAHLSGSTAELFKQGELDASGLYFFVVDAGFASAKVNGERAEHE